MTRSRGEHGGAPMRLVVADASAGKLSVPTFAARMAVVGSLTDDGAPVIREVDECFLDHRVVRVHDLQQDVARGVRDRRLAWQVVNDYEAEVSAPKDGMSPYAQAEEWTALNRSTREVDGFRRVALPGSQRRIVDSEDGKFAIATTLVEFDPAIASEVGGTPADLPPPEGVTFKGAGVESSGSGSVSRSAPSVSVNGVTVFGEAEVQAARDAINAGGTAKDALAAAQGKPFVPAAEADVQIATPPSAPTFAASPRPGGYVVNEAKKVGLLGSFFTPKLGQAVTAGREGTEIGVLPARGDAQFALSDTKRGRLHLKPDDVSSLPDEKKGQRFKGWLMFDSSLAGQDSKLPGDLGQFRPVIPVTAKIPPSREPPPPPPKKKPKDAIFVPGGTPGGPSGSKGKAELYPGGSSGDVPPGKPDAGGGGGGDSGNGVSAGGTGTEPLGPGNGAGGAGGIRTGGGTGEGAGAVSTGVSNPQSQERDLTGQSVAPAPCPLTTAGGTATSAGGKATASEPGEPDNALPEDFYAPYSTPTGTGTPDPLPEDFYSPSSTPGGTNTPDPLPDDFYNPYGYPALQVAGGQAFIGGNAGGSGAQAIDIKGSVQSTAPFGHHNVLTTPVPVMGQAGAPVDVEGQLAWLSHTVESIRQGWMALAAGPNHLESNLAAIHRNSPGNPPAGSTIGAEWSAGPGEAVRVDQAPLSVPGRLHAEAGGQITRTGTGIFSVVREHTGDGTVVDQAPAIYVDNRTRGETVSTADAFTTHDRRAAVTGAGGLLGSSSTTHAVPGEVTDRTDLVQAGFVPPDQIGLKNPTNVDKAMWISIAGSAALRASRGYVSVVPPWLGGQNGGLHTAGVDETEVVDAIPLRTRGGTVQIVDDDNLTAVGGFALTRRKAGSTDGTTVLSMTSAAAGNSRSRIEVDVLDPEAILFVPVASRPAELAAIPGGRPGLWVDSADERPVYFTGDTLGVDRPLAFLDELGASGLPTRYVSGLVIRYASSSTITVSAGKARDKADGADMTLAAEVTVSTASAGALGYETKNLTGTATITSGSNAVTGSGTAFLTEFCPSNTRRALTGTISSAAGVVTGTGTKFLSEVTAGTGAGLTGDLIGTTDAKGFWQVTAVNSDTSLTISLAGGAADPGFATGDAGGAKVIECPVLGTAGGRRYQVERITSDTALRVGPVLPSATEAGVAITATAGGPNPSQTHGHWRSVWLVSGGSGTTVILSTQRTAPLCTSSGTVSPSGYGTSHRRIGWVLLAATTHDLMPIHYTDGGCHRRADYESTSSVGDQTIVSNAAATTTWQTALATPAAPPSARVIFLIVQSVSPNTVGYIIIRGRGMHNGNATVAAYRANGPATSTSTVSFGFEHCPCDGAQAIEWGSNVATTGDGTFIQVMGYEDTLE